VCNGFFGFLAAKRAQAATREAPYPPREDPSNKDLGAVFLP
jgi:hypothetical protein